MTRTTVLVLEDQRYRVEALVEVMPKGSDIVWCESVPKFAVVYQHRGGEADIVILDHDLDLAGFGSEPVGDGMEAVGVMCSHSHRPPVVVWSWNGPRRGLMVAELRLAGFHAEGLPFGPEMLKGLAGWFG